MTYQVRKIGDHDWQDDDFSSRAPKIMSGYEYRIKPETAAPKWPQTTMTGSELDDWFQSTRLTPSQIEVIMDGVNKAIAKECQSGALVPSDKVREIEAKARAEGVKEGRRKEQDLRRYDNWVGCHNGLTFSQSMIEIQREQQTAICRGSKGPA